MSRVFIPLSQAERDALIRLAEIEYREPQTQARFIIRQALVERGLLTQPDPAPATALPAEDPKSREGGEHVTA